MSLLPGLTLEDYVEWHYNLVVQDDRPDVNPSLRMAEMLGAAPSPRIKASDFAQILALFEPWREGVEDALLDFDEETQSWRTYSQCVFERIPAEIFDRGNALIQVALQRNAVL